jgi:hypothetical protein
MSTLTPSLAAIGPRPTASPRSSRRAGHSTEAPSRPAKSPAGDGPIAARSPHPMWSTITAVCGRAPPGRNRRRRPEDLVGPAQLGIPKFPLLDAVLHRRRDPRTLAGVDRALFDRLPHRVGPDVQQLTDPPAGLQHRLLREVPPAVLIRPPPGPITGRLVVLPRRGRSSSRASGSMRRSHGVGRCSPPSSY